ncbi:hypothetical protein ES707_09668 [subsurface metagenome]
MKSGEVHKRYIHILIVRCLCEECSDEAIS